LERRLSEVADKAAADTLEDVSIKGDELKVSPLKAITPEKAEALADRFYRMTPSARNQMTITRFHPIRSSHVVSPPNFIVFAWRLRCG
jgi:hypothetical protein